MWKIKEAFDEMNRAWGITFPAEDLAARSAGEILEQGWLILYRFGEEDGAEYLDVYEQHRMTGDRHLRILGTGAVLDLPSMRDMLFFPVNASREEVARIQEEHDRANEEAGRIWQEKWDAQYRRAVRRVWNMIHQRTESEE